MKATFAILFVATLLLVPMASAAATAAPAPASVAPAGTAASPQPPAASANPAGAAAPVQPATPPAEWLFACVPQCSYYQGICQEECSGLGGIKSFSCTPPPPGICAHFTCVCNRGL